jgi:hypothetical protein
MLGNVIVTRKISFHPRGGISDGASARRPRPLSLSPGAGTGSFSAGRSVSEARIGVGDDPRPIRKKAPTTAIVAVIQSILETSMLRRRGSPERTIPSRGLSELIHEGSHNRDQIQRSRIIGVPARMVLLDTQLGRGGYPSLDGVRPAAHTGPHLLARASRCSRPPGISLVRATSKFHSVSIGRSRRRGRRLDGGRLLALLSNDAE